MLDKRMPRTLHRVVWRTTHVFVGAHFLGNDSRLHCFKNTCWQAMLMAVEWQGAHAEGPAREHMAKEYVCENICSALCARQMYWRPTETITRNKKINHFAFALYVEFIKISFRIYRENCGDLPTMMIIIYEHYEHQRPFPQPEFIARMMWMRWNV